MRGCVTALYPSTVTVLKQLKRKRIIQKGALSGRREEGEEPQQRQHVAMEDHFQKPCMYSSQYMQFSRIFCLFSSIAISKRPRLSRKAFLLEDDMDHDGEGSQEERRCGLVPYNDVWVHHAEHMCM